MPQKKIHSHLRRNKFSLDTLIDLSESFQVSLQATLIRFGEVGTHSIFAVFSKKNIFEWFVISNDFPKWKPKYKRGDTIPETNKELGIREIDIEDWFIPSSNDTRLNKRVYEQCFLSDYYVISLIWFD